MRKVKIAISLDKELLDEVDRSVDGEVIRSRSQAMELALRKGLREKEIDTAVIMIAAKHHDVLFKKLKEKKLIEQHLDFFIRNKIQKLFITTQHSKYSEELHEVPVILLEKVDAQFRLQYLFRKTENKKCRARPKPQERKCIVVEPPR